MKDVFSTESADIPFEFVHTAVTVRLISDQDPHTFKGLSGHFSILISHLTVDPNSKMQKKI